MAFSMLGDQSVLRSPPRVHWQIHMQLSAAEAVWREFQLVADCTVFQTFEWLSEWHRAIGAGRGVTPVIVLGRRDDLRPLILLPLAVEHGALARRLTWLGSELCDYNAPLVATDFAEYLGPISFCDLWSEMVGLIRQRPELHFDLIDIEKLPEAIGSQRNPMLDLRTLPATFRAHAATLRDWRGWEQFYAAKASAKTRVTDRRKLRRLSRRGQVSFKDMLMPEEIRRTMDLLIGQKQRSFARMGVADMFRRAGCREFFRTIATSPGLCDIVHVSRLDVGGHPAATGLGLRFRGCYYLILSSYDDGELARHSPGRAHIRELLRYAVAGKFDKFDFTIGDEDYKLHWSDVHMNVAGHLRAATARGWLAVGIKLLVYRVDAFSRRKPRLRRPLERIRRFVTAAATF
jgi:CelD/BcsL family acetyltransferase involved in cellulose biosynthesis